MKLSELKAFLSRVDQVQFSFANGQHVPVHAHVTEVGQIVKDFIDCGGQVHHVRKISFQLWVADDVEHRLSPARFLSILHQSERTIGLPDVDIEVEYQGDATLGKFSLDVAQDTLLLLPMYTNCLAQDFCGIPQKPEAQPQAVSAPVCAPGKGCC